MNYIMSLCINIFGVTKSKKKKNIMENRLYDSSKCLMKLNEKKKKKKRKKVFMEAIITN